MWLASSSSAAHRKSAKWTQQLPMGFSGVMLIGTQSHTRAISALQERQNSSRRGAKAHDLNSCDDEPAVKAMQRAGWCRESRFESEDRRQTVALAFLFQGGQFQDAAGCAPESQI